jgi:nitrite reductase/ring-hydroxylating ferredoxin subunit/uncharacterized membrane protein
MGTPLRAIPEAAGRQNWLDALGDPLQKGIAGLYRAAGPGGQRVKNVLHGVWLGHPLHAVLTDAPIGFWTASCALDAIETIAGREEMAPGADATLALGLAGAAGAALAGLTDWQHIDGQARRIGLAHGLLNVSVTGLYALSLAMRLRGARKAGKAVAFAGWSLSNLSAYLGGNLVYEQRIGVDHARDLTGPADFVAVMPVADLPEDTPRKVDAGGTPVVLVRRDGQICALAETCAHLGGPLSEGTLKDGSIVCPWHGSRFDLASGDVLDGPSVFPQPHYETRERNGQIEVRAARGVE